MKLDGVITVTSPGKDRIRITYDDRKTDPGKITDALVRGGVDVPGKSTQAAEAPFSYR
ncbi:MAG: hypothetical protein PHI99_01770 [Syntrophales bacterium]|nr:hypothetical protein [Syntrophales bacterium]